MTLPKIPQGPVKSMSITPVESGYATETIPLLGSFRGFTAAADPDKSAPPIPAGAPGPATLLAASENGTAAMNPAAADLLSNSLRFILRRISRRKATMCMQGTCQEMAITLKTPAGKSLSDIAMLHQLTSCFAFNPLAVIDLPSHPA